MRPDLATKKPNPAHLAITKLQQNYDGEVLSEETYHYGDKIVVPQTGGVKGFAGWDKAVSEKCDGDATYIAVYKEESSGCFSSLQVGGVVLCALSIMVFAILLKKYRG